MNVCDAPCALIVSHLWADFDEIWCLDTLSNKKCNAEQFDKKNILLTVKNR